METWMNVEEYMLFTGKTKNAVYTMKSMDKKNPDKKSKYKHIDGRLFIDASEEIAQEETQAKFESLYYELIDKYPNVNQLCKALSPILKKKSNTIFMYFSDCFFTVSKSKAKKDYVLGMQKLLDSLHKDEIEFFS